MEQEERYFSCPYCWEQISMLIDTSIEEQTFVEDCEVCCHPIEISYTAMEGEITSMAVEKVQ